MSHQVQAVLAELEAFGRANDAQETEKGKRMRNVTTATGELLSFLIKASGAKRVLEIGTSNGYSTIWMADAMRTAAEVTLDGAVAQEADQAEVDAGQEAFVVTLEVDEEKARMAAANFARAGVADRIELRLGDAGSFLERAEAEEFEFIFMDSDRVEYQSWWADLQRILVPGGVIVVDNATSHRGELQPFIDLVAETAGVDSTVMEYEQGLVLINKR